MAALKIAKLLKLAARSRRDVEYGSHFKSAIVMKWRSENVSYQWRKWRSSAKAIMALKANNNGGEASLWRRKLRQKHLFSARKYRNEKKTKSKETPAKHMPRRQLKKLRRKRKRRNKRR